MSADFSSQTKHGAIYGWYVYVLYEDDGIYSKIGTAANVKYRLSGLRNGNPRVLKLFKVWHVKSRLEAFTLEREALRLAASKRVSNRDWVLLSHNLAARFVEKAISDLGIAAQEREV